MLVRWVQCRLRRAADAYLNRIGPAGFRRSRPRLVAAYHSLNACCLLVAFGLGGALIVAPDWLFALPFRSTLALAWSPILMAFVARRLHRLGMRSFGEWLWTRRYQVCLGCAYLLKGLEDRRNCPECGRAFSLEQTEKACVQWLGHKVYRRS